MRPFWILGSLLAGIAGMATFGRGSESPKPAKPIFALAKAGDTRKVPLVPTYAAHVAPILLEQCASCHRPGEVAPFSLLTYTDAKKRAAQIAQVVQSGFMPPWKAAPDYGSFCGERKLTDEQKQILANWALSGEKSGNLAQAPAPPKFPQGWAKGTPDVIFEPAETYRLKADGADVYRNFVVPTHYSEDRYVSAIEVRPGNRAVVHHVIAYLDTQGKARQLDALDKEPGYSSFGGVGFAPSGALGGWAPGNETPFLPKGVGILLPKGADIVLQVHYHTSGKPETDRTKIGVYFCKEPTDKRVRILPVFGGLNIPAGNADFKTGGASLLRGDVTLLSVTPHMHLLGREMRVKAITPEEREVPLVYVPDWDFNWQTTYTFKEPIKVPAGTKVKMTARYDNSTANPRNPSSPPKPVTWGEATTDEMCIAFVTYTVDGEHLLKGEKAAGFQNFGEKNGSGKK